MKKLIIYLLATLTILSITACQATPEKSIIEPKDNERLIEKALEQQSETTNETLKNKLGVPDEYVANRDYDGGKLKLIANANIVLPNVDTLPMYRVVPKDFSQELIDKLALEFYGNEPIYEYSYKRTKAQVEQDILNLKKTLADTNISQQQKNMFEEELARCEKEYAAAPDAKELVPATTKIKLQRPVVNGRKLDEYIGINVANESMTKAFGVSQNNTGDKITVEENESSNGETGYSVSDSASRGAHLTYYNANFIPKGNIFLPFNSYFADDFANQKPLVGSFEASDALNQVNALLKILDISDMQFSIVEYNYVIRENAQEKAGKKPSEEFFLQNAFDVVYKFNFERVVDNVPVVNGYISSYVGDAMFGKQWAYEKLEVAICTDGIIHFVWYSPHTITETITEDCKLLSFDEITKICETLFRANYQPQNGQNALTGNVDRVRLSLRRVMEQNSVEYGLFVPVWDFYGVMEFEDTNDGSDKASLSRNYYDVPILIINAIDGSIIDQDKGY